jgi:amino acid transporter
LGAIVWAHKGFAIDMAQVTLQGATPGGVLSGIVLVVFGFSGFESSTSLGDEAKDPLRTIPRSLLQSTMLSGLFFLFMAYVIILGFKGSGVDLGKSEAPLAFLAPQTGLGFLGTLINIGALLSFFSCTLACINSTARIVFSMSRHGLFHDALGEAHETNKTPHLAVALSASITFLVPAAVHLCGITAFDAQGYFGTLCSFGFLLVYVMVSVAAPMYLRALGKLRKRDVFYSLLGGGFMLLPILGMIGIPGSNLFPPPAFPNNLLIWLFVAYMAVGLVWLLIQRVRSPEMMPTMKNAMDEIDLKFRDVENVS